MLTRSAALRKIAARSANGIFSQELLASRAESMDLETSAVEALDQEAMESAWEAGMGCWETLADLHSLPPTTKGTSRGAFWRRAFTASWSFARSTEPLA